VDSVLLYIRAPAQCTVIHAFETYYIYTLLQKQLLRRPVVVVNNPDGGIVDVEVETMNRMMRWVWNRTVELTDLFIPWTQWTAGLMKRQFPNIPDEKIVVLHPGINLTQWPLRPSVTPTKRFQLLFVGGDLVRKGADTLLDAMDQGLSEHCDLHLCTQTPWLRQYSEIAARIERTPGVHLSRDLTVDSPELQSLFRTCDAFVLPTRAEAIPWVAIEALATGIPTIMTGVGGIPEVIRDGETGLIIPCEDPKSIVAAVDRLRTSPSLATDLRERGRLHVEQNYDVAKNTVKFLSLLKAAISNRA
jgi:glycosyltransferase involved in cell wall biosynthesis